MPLPDRDVITNAITELDRATSQDGALVRFQESFEPFGHIITANRIGMTRLGLECLRASQNHVNENSEPRTITNQTESLSYLSGGDLDNVLGLYVDDFLKYEPRQEIAPNQDKREQRLKLVVNSLFIGLFIFATIGGVATIRWLWSLFT